MERGCHSDRCRGRDFHIVRKRKKLGRKTKVMTVIIDAVLIMLIIVPGPDAEKSCILLQVEPVDALH